MPRDGVEDTEDRKVSQGLEGSYTYWARIQSRGWKANRIQYLTSWLRDTASGIAVKKDDIVAKVEDLQIDRVEGSRGGRKDGESGGGKSLQKLFLRA